LNDKIISLNNICKYFEQFPLIREKIEVFFLFLNNLLSLHHLKEKIQKHD